MAAKKATTKRKPAAKLGSRKERIARILVDAMHMGERKAAAEWGISHATVYNYWKLIDSDDEVLRIFTIEKNRREERWAARLNGPILKALDYFDRVFTEASPTDPETITAVTAAMNALIEAKTIAGMTHESFATDREAATANPTPATYSANNLGSGRAIASA